MRCAHEIAAKLRIRCAAGPNDAQATARPVTSKLADPAATAVARAEPLLTNVPLTLRQSGPGPRSYADAADATRRRRARRLAGPVALLKVTRRIVAQLLQRIAVITSVGAAWRVSLHDADGRPDEFGHKAQLVDNVDGIVLDDPVGRGNPPKAAQTASAVGPNWQSTRRTPRTDRGGIGYLERGYGLDRSRIDGTERTRILTGLGVIGS